MLLALILACATPAPVTPPSPAEEIAPEPAPPPPPPEPVRVQLAAVGDVLPHRAVKVSAAARGWTWTFEDVAPVLQAADVAFANLEAPIAPTSHRSGWEIFNAPGDLADGLAGAGLDVVSISNNHAWDQGPDGVVETVAQLERVGIRHAGAGATCEAARAPAILEVRGVRIAFFAVADLSNLDENGAPDAPCVWFAGDVCVGADCGPDRDAIHYRPDPERILAAIRPWRDQVDFVVLSFHWGNEFRTTSLPEYPPLARTLIDGGVDVILGHHPHVLQPIERIVTASGREGVVAYSLGNFVSNMGASYDPKTKAVSSGHTRDGGVLRVELVREPDGTRRVGTFELVPTFTVNDATQAPAAIRPTLVDHLPPDLAALRRGAIEAVIGPGGIAPARVGD